MYLHFILGRSREEAQLRKSLLERPLSLFPAVLPISCAFFCEFLLSFVPAHFICHNNSTCLAGHCSVSLKTSALLGCTWQSLDLLLYKPERVRVTRELSGDHGAATSHQMKQTPALKNPAGTK